MTIRNKEEFTFYTVSEIVLLWKLGFWTKTVPQNNNYLNTNMCSNIYTFLNIKVAATFYISDKVVFWYIYGLTIWMYDPVNHTLYVYWCYLHNQSSVKICVFKFGNIRTYRQ